jgi:RimJ/RimL family protein N-acetyltransferase
MITVRPFEKENFEKIITWNDRTDAFFMHQWAGTDYHYPLTREQLENHFTGDAVNQAGSRSYSFGIHHTDELIGMIDLIRINREQSTGTLAHVLIGDKQNRGKGYGSCAVTELVKIAHLEHGLKRIRLYVYEHNTAALRCYLKNGFILKTIIPKSIKTAAGQWYGCCYMERNRLR